MNKREVWCYKCGTKLWGEKPDPDHPFFTFGYCHNHGWVPDHKGRQVNDEPIKETQPVNPQNSYSITKTAADAY